MLGTWISLPASWKLQDVQAGLNVCVTSLSFLGLYVCVRFYWQRALRRIVQGESVPLSALLTVSNLGEAYDTIRLFWRGFVNVQFAGVWLQCFMVICLSAVAIFSGPIARYATRWNTLIMPTCNNVSTVTGGIEGYATDFAKINSTWVRLDNASFPTDQFLDFLPNTAADWVYNPTQWQNRWSLNCNSSEQANSSLQASGNCSHGRVLPQLSGLQNILTSLNMSFRALGRGVGVGGIDYALLGGFAMNITRVDDNLQASELHLGLGAVSVRGLKVRTRTDPNCLFGEGGTYNVSQIMVSCRASRRDDIRTSFPSSQPGLINNTDIIGRLVDYFYPEFQSLAANNISTSLPTTYQLLRFLQVYTILWETQVIATQPRDIDSRVPVVQVSVAFTATTVTLAGLIVCGLAYYKFFNWKHRHFRSIVPLTKIDWMIQSIEAEDRPHFDSKGRQRWSATVDRVSLMHDIPYEKRRKTEFITARFSDRETSTWFLDHTTRSVVSRSESLWSPQSDVSELTIQVPDGQSGGRVEAKETTTKEVVRPFRKLSGYEVLEVEPDDRYIIKCQQDT